MKFAWGFGHGRGQGLDIDINFFTRVQYSIIVYMRNACQQGESYA